MSITYAYRSILWHMHIIIDCPACGGEVIARVYKGVNLRHECTKCNWGK